MRISDWSSDVCSSDLQVENVFVMAGIPAIMQAMFASLQHRLVGGTPLKSRTVAVAMGESFVADGLARLQARFPEVEIGSYPFNRNGVFGTRLEIGRAHV